MCARPLLQVLHQRFVMRREMKFTPALCAEHASAQHAIQEWNKMGAVRYCVQYIERAAMQRQLSSASERNRRALSEYLAEVERQCHDMLNERHGACFAARIASIRSTLHQV